ncbi:YbhB/YbcL family Raf kinase inhibitor-like protein [Flavobacterium pectinovorum]|uniref:Phospholipid-binding protein, PBP family n=1 Tax=Flavobacterium pectinovorum TaxID=29533 RepID=A0ABY1J626_9FLAO|nr:phospholipid-binding protein, PBP family [Flavobacterium pectinovorum]
MKVLITKRIATLIVCLVMGTVSFAQKAFTLSSKNLQGQATAKERLNSLGCNGENQSPQLSWQNAPEGTKSFAITMFDSDAPTGSGWWHWIVFDIPANVNDLVSGAGNISAKLTPKGAVQSLTDFGVPGYGGSCPPPNTGIHKYTITVYALKTDHLGLNENTLPPGVGFNLFKNTLAQASLVFYDQY